MYPPLDVFKAKLRATCRLQLKTVSFLGTQTCLENSVEHCVNMCTIFGIILHAKL